MNTRHCNKEFAARKDVYRAVESEKKCGLETCMDD